MTRGRAAGSGPGGLGWTFLSNHAHVLICVAQEPGIRLRDVAERVGITERAVQRIVADLEEGGYLTRARAGRRNLYKVHTDRPLRHPIEAHREVRALLSLALGAGEICDQSPADRSRDDRNAAGPPSPSTAPNPAFDADRGPVPVPRAVGQARRPGASTRKS